jgi:hypothetical protein
VRRPLRAPPPGDFFLWRQTELEELVFEDVKIGHRVAAKAPHGPTGLLAVGKLLPELAPARGIARPEIGGCKAALAGGDGGDEAHRAANDRARRGVLAAGSAALMIAGRPEIVLQIVVRSGEIGHVVAVEQTRPVAAGHLEEVAHGGAQRAGGCLSLDHLGQEGGIGAADLGPRMTCLIGE